MFTTTGIDIYIHFLNTQIKKIKQKMASKIIMQNFEPKALNRQILKSIILYE